jgi:DNA repair protein RadC
MSLNTRIQQLPQSDRPREKLLARGVASLSDFELLEVFVGNGSASADVGYIARRIQKLLEKGIESLRYEDLIAIRGINVAIACKIMSALELSRRHLVQGNKPLRSQQDILARLSNIRTKHQEHFVVLTLDGGQRLIAQRIVAIGTLDTVLAHPREVFADAIADRAASIIAAHNHPSGDARPSQKDISLTQQLVAAGQLLGVTLADHIIVTDTSHYSCRQHHML